MDKPVGDIHFKFMAFCLKIRDVLLPVKTILKEAGIKPGFTVLDFGCGLGSFTVPAAEIVGKTGKVYALDIHPLAIQAVQNAASKKELKNIETISSGCATGLEKCHVDVVLLYDTFHMLTDPDAVLEELQRVLKPNGILSFSDHHMNQNEIIPTITNRGLFGLLRKGKRTYSFMNRNGMEK